MHLQHVARPQTHFDVLRAQGTCLANVVLSSPAGAGNSVFSNLFAGFWGTSSWGEMEMKAVTLPHTASWIWKRNPGTWKETQLLKGRMKEGKRTRDIGEWRTQVPYQHLCFHTCSRECGSVVSVYHVEWVVLRYRVSYMHVDNVVMNCECCVLGRTFVRSRVSTLVFLLIMDAMNSRVRMLLAGTGSLHRNSLSSESAQWALLFILMDSTLSHFQPAPKTSFTSRVYNSHTRYFVIMITSPISDMILLADGR